MSGPLSFAIIAATFVVSIFVARRMKLGMPIFPPDNWDTMTIPEQTRWSEAAIRELATTVAHRWQRLVVASATLFAIILTGVFGIQESNRDAEAASKAAVAADDRTRQNLADLSVVRETAFLDTCKEFNERRDFDEFVLQQEARPATVSSEDIPNLDTFPPNIIELIAFVDMQNRAQQAEDEAALAEFIERFPRRDCDAESEARIDATAEVLGDDIDD